MGGKKFPKEQLRAFSGGKICEPDNCIRFIQYGNGKTIKTKPRQNKGFAEEYVHIAAIACANVKKDASMDAFLNHRLPITAMKDAKGME